jgi:hypothetical protein
MREMAVSQRSSEDPINTTYLLGDAPETAISRVNGPSRKPDGSLSAWSIPSRGRSPRYIAAVRPGHARSDPMAGALTP